MTKANSTDGLSWTDILLLIHIYNLVSKGWSTSNLASYIYIKYPQTAFRMISLDVESITITGGTKWIKIEDIKAVYYDVVYQLSNMIDETGAPRECGICKKKFDDHETMKRHVASGHKITIRDYYDIYVRREYEGLCKECNTKTKFMGLELGYARLCNSCSKSVNIDGTKRLIIDLLDFEKNKGQLKDD